MQPNFLFLIADQLRADHLGTYGNTVVRTPHIDALAAQGTLMQACYVASPICMPNRASLMTGRMPLTHGVRHNGIALDQRAMTFVERLRQDGYATALIGKAHLQNMTGRPAFYPPAGARLAHEAFAADAARYDQEWMPRWRDDPDFDVSTPFYGFDTVRFTVEHSDDLWGHYRRWARAKQPDIDTLIGPDNALPSPDYRLTESRQAWRTRVPEELYSTTYIAEQAVECLQRFAGDGKPFFLKCSFPDPHHPFTPPGRYWSMYDPAAMRLPGSFHVPFRGMAPPHLAWLLNQRDAGKAVKHTQVMFACTEREAQEAIALNYGSISFIDDAIGRILAALRAHGLAENTVVILTSDHGDYMGDHQLLLKGPLHYEGLIRVPLIWRDPQLGPQAPIQALASTIDLAPSILQRASVQPYNGIQGRSLLPLLRGESAPWRSALLIEEEGQRTYCGFDDRVRMRTLIRPPFRLSVYEGIAWGELYDRSADPDELENLWDVPAHAGVKADLLHCLAQTMIGHSESSPYPSAVA
ncbi:MAG: sulfatase [Burkholderiaceae bacterium]